MAPATERKKYDVVIAGAGPAGCTCALALKDAGLAVCLIDKADFPRDKVCGDAIPARALKTLASIDPQLADAFRAYPGKLLSKRTRVGYKGRELLVDWVLEAFTCARIDFDNLLFELVKERTQTDIYTGVTIAAVTTKGDGVVLHSNDMVFEAGVLIGADGAQSVTAKQLVNKTMDRQHHVGSVRAYYDNIAGLDAHTSEIYFIKEFLPSYLWVFPLPGNRANVGFGMLSSEIARRKINLKQSFYDFISASPDLAARFKDARMIGRLEGFGLPLGSRRIKISGERFMLTGDAASLIDPIWGEGIGNAMLSGKLAAEQAMRCFSESAFDEAFMGAYDKQLFGAIGDELKTHYTAQRVLAKMPVLLDAGFALAQNSYVKKIIKKYL